MLIIGTHGNKEGRGIHHADEIFGIAILKGYVPEFRDARIVRSRDPAVLATCDVRIDVGGKYNPSTGDFDHHQPGGAGVRPNRLPKAAAGIVFENYGVDICGEPMVAAIIDRRLIAPVDASDYRIRLYGRPRFRGVHAYSVSQVIAGFNGEHNGFNRALELAIHILGSEIRRGHKAINAAPVVLDAMKGQIDPRLLVLEEYCLWSAVLPMVAPRVELVIFPLKGESEGWMMYAAPDPVNQYGSKILLPHEWAGKTGEALERASGIKGLVFCHNQRYALRASSQEALIKAAIHVLGIRPSVVAPREEVGAVSLNPFDVRGEDKGLRSIL